MKTLLSLAILLASTAAQAAFAPCAPTLTLSVSSFVAVTQPNNISKHELWLDKAKFVNSNLTGEIPLWLERKQGNGKSQTCVYGGSGFSLLTVTLVETKGMLKLTIENTFSTKAKGEDWEDLIICENSAYATKSIRSGAPLDFGNLEISSRYKYYSTCGFIDCTEEAETFTTLGTLGNVQLR